MAKSKAQKQKIVEDLKEKIGQQKIMVFVDYQNLKVRDLFELRKRLKEKDCQLKVAKKTLINLSFKDFNSSLGQKIKKLAGQIAIIFGFKDEIMPAKIIWQFSQKNENLKILGGLKKVESSKFKVQSYEFLDAKKLIELAKIPAKEELLARLVSSISAPISNFVNVLEGNLKNLVLILKQLTVNSEQRTN